MEILHMDRADVSTSRYFCFTRLSGARVVVLASALSAATLLAGCKNSNEGGFGSRGDTRLGTTSMGDAKAAAELEKQHVIGPDAARELNHFLDWQNIDAGRNIKHLSVQNDSVFALDRDNFLTRIKVEDGTRMWRVAVADPIEEILGVKFIDHYVYVTTGGAILVLDGSNGTQIGKQRLTTIASTQSEEAGPFLLYGSRNGQLVWHSRAVGQPWKSYQVSHFIHLPPIVAQNYIVVVGAAGRVMVFSASNATQIWGKQLLDGVVAEPKIGNGIVYLAGLDQYLWAYDLSSGRNLWKYLTESPLREAPFVAGDRVYQHIPGKGLVAFDAAPQDSPGGVKRWEAAGVNGNVVKQAGSELYVWDARARRLSVVDAARGSLIKTLDLPQADRLITAGENNADIYAASNDGRIVRLVPRT